MRTPRSYGRGRGRGRDSSARAPQTPDKKGLFEDGQWLCEFTSSTSQCAQKNRELILPPLGDCKPRKPAIQFQVKKEGPNKGRYFYTCEARKCKFFLWETDAQPRERDALMVHNCRSENGIVARVQPRGEPIPPPNFPARTSASAGPSRQPQQQQQQQHDASSQEDYLADEPPPDYDEVMRGLLSGGDRDYSIGTPASSQTLGSSSFTPATSSRARGVTASQQQQHQQQPATPSHANNGKRKRTRVGFIDDSSDDDLLGASDLDDPDTERQLAALADASVARTTDPRTPSAARGPGGGMLPTPVSRNSLPVTSEDRRQREAKRTRLAGASPGRQAGTLMEEQQEEEDNDHFAPNNQGRLLFPPQPGRSTHSLGLGLSEADTRSSTPTIGTPRTAADISTTVQPSLTEEVMRLLTDHHPPLPTSLTARVRAVLQRHELKSIGVQRGRDTARAALDAREARVAELQARVVALENARRLDRARLREVSEGLVRLSQEDENEDGGMM